jgi:NADH dehydrogenase
MIPIRDVLVLGGTGFVGSHLVPRLVSSGFRVTLATRRRDNARHLFLLPTVTVIEADVHDPAALGRLARSCDAIVNLVGIINEAGRETFARSHVELPRNVIAASKAAGVRRLVHMSGLHADPKGPSLYLRSKGEAEAAVAASGLDWTIFRPSVIFGRGDSFLAMFARLLRAAPVIPLGSPGARFQPVFVGDVAHCFTQAITDDRTVGQRYDLCGPKVYTLRELVTYVGEASGHVRPIVPLSPALSRLQATLLEHLPGKMMSRDNLASMTLDSVCDCPFPPVFDIEPASVETIAPQYLAPDALRGAYDDYRAQAGR